MIRNIDTQSNRSRYDSFISVACYAIVQRIVHACKELTTYCTMHAPQVMHWMLSHGHFGIPAIAASLAKHPAAWNANAHGGMVRSRLPTRSMSS